MAFLSVAYPGLTNVVNRYKNVSENVNKYVNAYILKFIYEAIYFESKIPIVNIKEIMPKAINP